MSTLCSHYEYDMGLKYLSFISNILENSNFVIHCKFILFELITIACYSLSSLGRYKLYEFTSCSFTMNCAPEF